MVCRTKTSFFYIINACAFDVIAQILFVSYADSQEYAYFIEDRKEETLFELTSNAIRDGIVWSEPIENAHTYHCVPKAVSERVLRSRQPKNDGGLRKPRKMTM